jgi:hypothetical protein
MKGGIGSQISYLFPKQEEECRRKKEEMCKNGIYVSMRSRGEEKKK